MLEYFVYLDKDDPPTDLVLAVAELPEDVPKESMQVSDLLATGAMAAPTRANKVWR